MTDKEMTQKDLNNLYSISVVPTVLVFALAVGYYGFVHLEQIQSPDSLMWDLLVNLFPLILIPMPITFFSTFEILYWLRMKSPTRLHVKRFLGRMFTVLVSGLVFVLIYAVSFVFLVPLVSERMAMLCGFLIWLLVLGVMTSRVRHFLHRLGEGEW